jgi:hypothetical protein
MKFYIKVLIALFVLFLFATETGNANVTKTILIPYDLPDGYRLVETKGDDRMGEIGFTEKWNTKKPGDPKYHKTKKGKPLKYNFHSEVTVERYYPVRYTTDQFFNHYKMHISHTFNLKTAPNGKVIGRKCNSIVGEPRDKGYKSIVTIFIKDPVVCVVRINNIIGLSEKV